MHRCTFLALLALIALRGTGCTFDQSGIGLDPLDAAPADDTPNSSRDAAVDGLDVAPAPDLPAGGDQGAEPAAVDQAAVDQATVDQTAPDHAAVDQATPDLTPDLTPDIDPPSCDDIYQTLVPSYEPCGESEASCSFYFYDSNKASCDDLCAAGGGSCDAAFYDTAGDCTTSGPATCAETHFDAVCVCTR